MTLFLEAFFGLQPWDLMPALFDQLLLHPKLKPKGPAAGQLTSRIWTPPARRTRWSVRRPAQTAAVSPASLGSASAPGH